MVLLKRLNCLELAWPVDLFRRLIGALSFYYFASLFREKGLYCSPSGLVDHSLVIDIFPHTRQPLFNVVFNDSWISFIYLGAMVASLLVVVGYRTRLLSFVLYVIAVCSFRWNFLVINVDDGFMHLFLLWCVLLPDGKTRFLRNVSLKNKIGSASVTFFLVNISLMYAVAGITKWFSPMWLDGTAVFVIEKLSFTRFPEFWQPDMMPALKLLTWSALIVEPALALMPWLPTGSRLKLLLGVMAVGMHMFIICTLGFVFANVTCLLALIVVFRKELQRPAETALSFVPWRRSDYCSLVVVVLLCCAMVLSTVNQAPWRSSSSYGDIKTHRLHNPEMGDHVQGLFYGGLWILGLAQSYQLLNWIDDRNYALKLDAEIFEGANKVDAVSDLQTQLPSSLRMNLLYTYIFDVTWHYVEPKKREVLGEDLTLRMAKHLCARNGKKWLSKNIKLTYSLFRICPYGDEVFVSVVKDKTLLEFTCTSINETK